MKTNKIFILFLYLCCLSACTVRPRSVLSQSEMVDVLVDLHKTEGILKVAGLNYGHQSEEVSYYLQVLDKHGITQAQFDSSLVWYTDNPRFFDKIYPKVVAELKKELDAYNYLDETKSEEETVEDNSVKSLEQLLQEAQYGLPRPYEPKNLHFTIDTTFIYVQI